jgi:PknH-like extracellular domain
MPGSATRSPARAWSALAAGCAVALVAACTHTVTGAAIRATPGIDDESRSPVDVESVMLKQTQMRAITGAGDDLTIIPSMDGKFPVDIEVLAEPAPAPCRWFFEETKTFGPEVEEFHKTTYQNPPDGGLISQGAAAYRDPPTARRAFDGLAGRVDECESSGEGSIFVGDVTTSVDSLELRSGACGRDYQVKSVVLVEVTFCRFPPSVPDIVMTNLLEHVPG